MELTPEERQRIYEEEKVRIEAREQIEAETLKQRAQAEADKQRNSARSETYPPISQAKIGNESKPKALNRPFPNCVGCGVVAVIVFGLIGSMQPKEPDAKTSTANSPISSSQAQTTPSPKSDTETSSHPYLTDLGAEGHLAGAELEKGGRSKFVFLASTKDDFQEFTKYNVAGDKVGMQQLLESGRVFAVPSGTVRAKKIDSEWTGLIQVRLLSGEHLNEAAWTYMEGLQK